MAMATGAYGLNKENRNMGVQMEHVASVIGSGTATAGAVTLNDYMGKVTTNASSANADAGYSLVITNDKVAAGDMAFASVTLSTGTAQSYHVQSVLCGDGTLTITLQNGDADTAWSSAVFIVSFMVIKAIS